MKCSPANSAVSRSIRLFCAGSGFKAIGGRADFEKVAAELTEEFGGATAFVQAPARKGCGKRATERNAMRSSSSRQWRKPWMSAGGAIIGKR